MSTRRFAAIYLAVELQNRPEKSIEILERRVPRCQSRCQSHTERTFAAGVSRFARALLRQALCMHSRVQYKFQEWAAGVVGYDRLNAAGSLSRLPRGIS